MSRKAGEMWKSLDAVDKEKYEELAVKDRERYDNEVQIVGKRVRISHVEASSGKKAHKDYGAPKQPLSAFFMWVQDCREKSKKTESRRRMEKDLSYEAWKRADKETQKTYEDKAASAREQYRIDLDAYHLRLAACHGSPLAMQSCWGMRNHEKCERAATDICECGEPFKGLLFCENCGEGNPCHPDSMKHKEDLDPSVPNAQEDNIDIESTEMARSCDECMSVTKEQVLKLAQTLPKHEIQWLHEHLAWMTVTSIEQNSC